MKELLIKYLEFELDQFKASLNDWMKGPAGHVTQKMCDDSCAYFSSKIDFNNEAIAWLKSLP